MQMIAEFKEEQIGTPFVWVGALEGGGRGGGGKRGSNPKNTRDVQYFFFSPSCFPSNKFVNSFYCMHFEFMCAYTSDTGGSLFLRSLALFLTQQLLRLHRIVSRLMSGSNES